MTPLGRRCSVGRHGRSPEAEQARDAANAGTGSSLIAVLCIPNPVARGVTMLELLFVTFIISILAMVAIPFYQDYSARTKVSEGIQLASAAQSAVVESFFTSGKWPIDNTLAGLPDPGEYATDWVQDIAVSDTPAPGAIVVRYRSSILPGGSADNTLIFVPKFDGKVVRWTCDEGTLAADLRPRACR